MDTGIPPFYPRMRCLITANRHVFYEICCLLLFGYIPHLPHNQHTPDVSPPCVAGIIPTARPLRDCIIDRIFDESARSPRFWTGWSLCAWWRRPCAPKSATACMDGRQISKLWTVIRVELWRWRGWLQPLIGGIGSHQLHPLAPAIGGWGDIRWSRGGLADQVWRKLIQMRAGI